jgi:hypothetical protein
MKPEGLPPGSGLDASNQKFLSTLYHHAPASESPGICGFWPKAECPVFVRIPVFAGKFLPLSAYKSIQG